MKLDERKIKIIEAVVDAYIQTGEPVGSKAVSVVLNHAVSSATIRNDMAALEKAGFLEQPHTSAGRVPTYLGYRLYIEKLMQPKSLTAKEKALIDSMLDNREGTASAVIEKALDALVELTGYATVNTIYSPAFTVISRVEVIPTGRRLYALLLITSAGEIKNKICRVEVDLTHEQIDFFIKVINDSLQGQSAVDLSPAVLQNVAVALGGYMMSLSPLLYAVYEISEEMRETNIKMHGEERILAYMDADPKEIATFFSRKEALIKMLDHALDGIHVIFGKENNSFTISNSSIIVSNYHDGAFGVIGPIRLDYRKIIPYIQYFSDSVNKMLNELREEDRKEDLHNGR